MDWFSATRLLHFIGISNTDLLIALNWWWNQWVETLRERTFKDMIRAYFALVISAFQKEHCFHGFIQTILAVPEVGSSCSETPLTNLSPWPSSIMWHPWWNQAGPAAISGHCYIYMTIRRDLPASTCVSWSVCLYDFIAWWRCCSGYVDHSQKSKFTDAAFEIRKTSGNLDYQSICYTGNEIVQVIFLENIRNNQLNKVICFCLADYPAPRAVLTGHDQEVVCVSVCAELGLVISGAKG